MKRTTLKKVNEAIEKAFPNVFLVKGEGYFYIASDDEATGLKIAGLFQTSVYVCNLSAYTPEQWVNEVRRLFEEDTASGVSVTSIG